MGYSAFDPISLADVRSVRNKIDVGGITADVIAVGDVVRYDAVADTYVLAQANNTENSNFVGVVESVSGNDIVLVYSGEISLPDSVMSLISGYTGAQIFYLSDTQEGKLTAVPPSNPGSVIKPVIITKGTALDSQDVIDGIVVNSDGTRISGDSSVDLSDIQPVGSVLAFAGGTGDIPDGWQICDGGELSTTTYSDLYAALNDGKIYGFIQNVNMSKVANSGSAVLNSDNLIGTVFYVNKTGLPGSFRCTVLSGTATGTTVTGAEVLVEPTYYDGSLVGSYHNTEIAFGDFCRIYVGDQVLDAVYQITNSPSKTKFLKPDMRARFIIGSSRGLTGLESTAFNTYTIGNVGGEEFHALNAGEIPIHAHGITWTIQLAGDVGVTHDLITEFAGAHSHFGRPFSSGADPSDAVSRKGIRADLEPGAENPNPQNPPQRNVTTVDGNHSHNITGNIYVSATDLLPTINATVGNVGGDLPHNNVPQHIVMYWIIKVRKDSYAKIYKLGPSGGGAIVAKNTAKRWARMSTPGAGCTVDISYGAWGVARLGTGHYQFTHDLITDLGTADQTKYIVEATVVKGNSGATQMFISNPYDLQGITFGVRIYDILGATYSDNFQYLSLTIYGGGTAI